MSGTVAICTGEVTLDLIQTGRTSLGTPVFEAHPGGAPLNVAAGLSRSGLDASVWSAVGPDPAGEQVRAHLGRLAIPDDDLRTDPKHPTRVAFIQRQAGGSRRTRVAPGETADQFLDPQALPIRLSSCDVFYFSGAALIGDATASAVSRALDELRRRPGAVVAFDPNIHVGRTARGDEIRRRIRQIIPVIDVLQYAGNRADEYWTSEAEPVLASVPLIIQTNGSGGAELRTPQCSVSVSAAKADVVDTTGAGDAFLSSILARFAATAPAERPNLGPATLEAWGRTAAVRAAEIVGNVGGTTGYLRSAT